MATNFRSKIGEIGLLTFICCFGIPQLIGMSQFWFQKYHWRWSGYTV